MNTIELEKILNDIGDLKYTNERGKTIFSGCEVAIHYDRSGRWMVWLTDSIDGDARDGVYHTAEAFRCVDGEFDDPYPLDVGESFSPECGECFNVFSDCGKTLEEAVNKLAAKVAILRQNPDYILVFPWEEIKPQEFLSEEEYLDLKNEVEKDYAQWCSMKEQKKS